MLFFIKYNYLFYTWRIACDILNYSMKTIFSGFCALAEPWESFLIGVIGSLVSLGGIELLDKLKIDDPVGEDWQNLLYSYLKF